MTQKEPPRAEETPQVSPNVAAWVERMARFLDRVESKLEIRRIEQVPEPVRAELRELHDEAAEVRQHVPAAPPLADASAPAPARRWVVKIDLDLVRSRMSAADDAAYSREDAAKFLADAGFRSLDGYWTVEEAELSHVEPDEVSHVLTEAECRTLEDALDWAENQGQKGNGATAGWLAFLVLLLLDAVAILVWIFLRPGK